MIADLGYGVETFPSREEAISGFRTDPNRFQFALLDGAAGNLATEVRAMRPELPVILCVAAGETIEGAGYSAVLEKPFSMRELAVALRGR